MVSYIRDSQMSAMEKRLNCRFCEDGIYSEMAQPLANYQEQTKPIEGITYGWYHGSLAELHKCVEAVDPEWVQYFQADSPVFCAFIGEKPVSFCQIERTDGSILAAPGLRVGSIGCVGTVPEHRGHGIALRMVDLAALELRKQGMDVSYIHYTFIDRWYQKLGYQVLARFRFLEG